MAGLSQPRSFFGIHSITPYSRNDGTFYGMLRVLASGGISFAGKVVPLTGGSNKYPWAVEEGEISAQLSMKFSEYPDFVYTLFMGATPTDNMADALGACSTATNKQGTSVVQATTGISAVSIISGSEGDLKFGKYVIKAITATTIQVYVSTDEDLARGTVETLAADGNAISSSTFTVTASADTQFTGWGLKVHGGSGSIAMTIGDTATFEVRPKTNSSVIWQVGAMSSTFPEFGCLIYAKKRSNEMFEIDCPRVKGEGAPMGLAKDKWAEADVKANLMYDATLDYVARFRYVNTVTPT